MFLKLIIFNLADRAELLSVSSRLGMAEEVSHLLNVLLTEYLTKVAPDTARQFQRLSSSPPAVASVVQQFSRSRTAPSKGNQLGLKDGLAISKRRKRKKVGIPSSG